MPLLRNPVSYEVNKMKSWVVFKCVYDASNIIFMYTSIGYVETHSAMCACSDSEWLRGQKILTFQVWITLPKSLIYLLSSGLPVQHQRLTCLPVHKASVPEKGKQFPQTEIHSTLHLGNTVICSLIIFPLTFSCNYWTELLSFIIPPAS